MLDSEDVEEECSPKIAFTALELLSYNYTLDYRPGLVQSIQSLILYHDNMSFWHLWDSPALFLNAFLTYRLNIPWILPQPATSRISSTTTLLIHLFLSMAICYTIRREYMSLPLLLGILALWRSSTPLRLEATPAISVFTTVFYAISVGQVSKLM
ncbi:unnamed protein product [Prunus brigantina]